MNARPLPLVAASEPAPGAVVLPSPAVVAEGLACLGDVCITCSDQAVAVRVVQLLDDDLALVDTGLRIEEVSVALVDVAVGDTVLVHAKEAIAVVES